MLNLVLFQNHDTSLKCTFPNFFKSNERVVAEYARCYDIGKLRIVPVEWLIGDDGQAAHIYGEIAIFRSNNHASQVRFKW